MQKPNRLRPALKECSKPFMQSFYELFFAKLFYDKAQKKKNYFLHLNDFKNDAIKLFFYDLRRKHKSERKAFLKHKTSLGRMFALLGGA